MKKIDIIMPTMWAGDNIVSNLEHYCQSPYINKIIIIDNKRKSRPTASVFKNSKIEIVDYGRNIYVNPAWNEGYYRSTAELICLLNDDINVDNDVFKFIVDQENLKFDIIGVNLKSGKDNDTIGNIPHSPTVVSRLNYDKTQPIGGQAWAFGICMFIKRESYCPIPSLYQIWFGDDYLVQRCQDVYVLSTSKISGVISKTIATSKSNDIAKRIELDTKNAYKFNDFHNGKQWDILKNNRFIRHDTFDREFMLARAVPSDINENVHILHELAKECKHITEMGVRTGVSTRAFLAADVQLISYDIVLDRSVARLFEIAKSQGKPVDYIKADVLQLEIAETDFLFIDTLHTYNQLKKELKLHAKKARKYLAFHDTYTFGLRGEDRKDNQGLLTAIIEFLIENPQWKFKIHKTNNNGLTVLERKENEI